MEEVRPLLTPKELSQWLRMSVIWVYKQAERGLIPFHRIGDAIRFDPEEIKAYLESRKNLKRSDLLVRRQEAKKSTSNIKGLQY